MRLGIDSTTDPRRAECAAACAEARRGLDVIALQGSVLDRVVDLILADLGLDAHTNPTAHDEPPLVEVRPAAPAEPPVQMGEPRRCSG